MWRPAPAARLPAPGSSVTRPVAMFTRMGENKIKNAGRMAGPAPMPNHTTPHHTTPPKSVQTRPWPGLILIGKILLCGPSAGGLHPAPGRSSRKTLHSTSFSNWSTCCSVSVSKKCIQKKRAQVMRAAQHLAGPGVCTVGMRRRALLVQAQVSRSLSTRASTWVARFKSFRSRCSSARLALDSSTVRGPAP